MGRHTNLPHRELLLKNHRGQHLRSKVTHTASNISDWATKWESTFSASSAVQSKFSDYYTVEETDELLATNEQHHVRVYLTPSTIALALSSEVSSSVGTTGGKIYFNTTTNHILYYVSTKYYSGTFPDPEFDNQPRQARPGDIVILTSTDGTENKIYVRKDSLDFIPVTDLKRIKDIEASIAACYTKTAADAKFRLISASYTKTEVNTKLNSYALTTKLADYVLTTTYNSNKTTTDNKISALETWKSSTTETLKILTDDANADGTINKWKEVVAFLNSITDDSGTNLKGLLDKKAAIGPKSSTNGITFTPTFSGLTAKTSNARYFSRLSPDSSGNLTYQQYKWVFELTIGSNTATALTITGLTGLSTTTGTNTWPYLTAHVYKQSSSGVFDLVDIDIQLQASKLVITWGKAPTSGEVYRIIITRCPHPHPPSSPIHPHAAPRHHHPRQVHRHQGHALHHIIIRRRLHHIIRHRHPQRHHHRHTLILRPHNKRHRRRRHHIRHLHHTHRSAAAPGRNISPHMAHSKANHRIHTPIHQHIPVRIIHQQARHHRLFRRRLLLRVPLLEARPRRCQPLHIHRTAHLRKAPKVTKIQGRPHPLTHHPIIIPPIIPSPRTLRISAEPSPESPAPIPLSPRIKKTCSSPTKTIS